MPSEYHLRLMHFIGVMYWVFLGLKSFRLESYILSNRGLGLLRRIFETFCRVWSGSLHFLTFSQMQRCRALRTLYHGSIYPAPESRVGGVTEVHHHAFRVSFKTYAFHRFYELGIFVFKGFQIRIIHSIE